MSAETTENKTDAQIANEIKDVMVSTFRKHCHYTVNIMAQTLAVHLAKADVLPVEDRYSDGDAVHLALMALGASMHDNIEAMKNGTDELFAFSNRLAEKYLNTFAAVTHGMVTMLCITVDRMAEQMGEIKNGQAWDEEEAE